MSESATEMNDLESSVVRFCAEAGADPLLVQGAGGNVSWKEGDTLWVKASGTWLSDAATQQIFVPVHLTALKAAIDSGNYPVAPTPISSSDLRPSIETLLHALMPHTVVVHLHAVDILARMVRRNCEDELNALIGSRLPWEIVDYFRPGAELAIAVRRALERNPDATVIFLKNHGVVFGGSDVEEIRRTLGAVIQSLREPIARELEPGHRDLASVAPAAIDGYVPIDDAQLHQLACDEHLFNRLTADWALYPDHVVFLGAHANVYDSIDELVAAVAVVDARPDLVFVRNIGVFVAGSFDRTKVVQLRCYFDVLVRQPRDAKLVPLPVDQIADLLARNDEKHRMRFSKP